MNAKARQLTSTLLTSLLLSSTVRLAAAQGFYLYGHSQPVLHLTQLSPNQVCPISIDGITSTSFPWTHNPTCIDLKVPSKPASTKERFCVYTNSLFAGGWGISLITTPEVATSYVLESFSHENQEDRGELPYEARATTNRGIGLFAKQDIAAGDLLMVKHPVLIMAKDLVDERLRKDRERLLKIAVGQLPENTGRLFRGLAKSMGGDVLDDVVHTNSIGMKIGGNVPHLGVVPEAARINHACRSNAYYRIDDYELKLEVFALKTIKAGDELTFSYGYSRHDHATRQQLIKENWGFKCTCPLCTSSSSTLSTSDSRLSEIASIKAVLPTGAENIPQLIAILPNLIKLLEEEDLPIEKPMYEEILAYSWSTMGMEERAKYWAGRARRGWEIVAGKDSWEAKRTRELEADVKGHPTWATWDKDPWDDGQWEDDEHGHGHEH